MARSTILFIALCGAVIVVSGDSANKPKNVLFIAVDDMRPNLGIYNSFVKTPNIDKLAAEGLTFWRAYVQYAYCSPSRNSFMTGRRPDTTRVWNFVDDFREPAVGADWISMPEYFKKHGYLTLGSGKLYHPGHPVNDDFPLSWTEKYPYFPTPKEPANLTCTDSFRPTYCAVDVAKEASYLQDQLIRDSCLSHLELAKQNENQPFFIGCGLHKPHVPWNFPKEFLDSVPPLDEIKIAADPYAPTGMPDPAWHFPADVRHLDIAFNGTCNVTISKIYRRAYYASIAYQDYIISTVLDKLEELGMANDTVVSLHGDHGWQLGEHDLWAKMSNFDLATRIPWIIRAPGKPNSHGKIAHSFVEAVDLYATLADLAGLPDPISMGQELNSTSLAPLFDDPSQKDFKLAAYSQFAKISNFSVSAAFDRNETKIMGYTVRVEDYRYTAWFPFDDTKIQPILSESLGRELYSHIGDDGDLDFPGENMNIIDDPDKQDIVTKLHQMLVDYIQLK